MELNTRQKNVVMAKDKNILCLATASAGKTATLTERIKRILDDGVAPSRIVAFTFTNQAADEMKKRIGDKSKEMYIGTIHAYANKICKLNRFSTRSFIAKEEFDKIIELALKVSWSKYPPVDYLFVDEFQDTDSLQYSFIKKIPAKNRFYCGDERQFIYGFKGSTDRFIRELATDDNFKKYFLVENYRNPPNIIKYADDFLGNIEKISPSTIPTKEKDGFLDECDFSDAVEEITWTKNWGKWAILCRTNNEVFEAMKYLEEMEIPHVMIRRGDFDLNSMEKILKQDKVKIMTIHASKSLEFDNVIVVGAKIFNFDERRISYVAATRAKESLYWCPPLLTGKDLQIKGINKRIQGNIQF